MGNQFTLRSIEAALVRADVKMLERDRMLGFRLGPIAGVSRKERHRTRLLAQHLRNASFASFFGPASLPPTFECPVDMVKTASVAERWDGGKWLCGLQLLDPRPEQGGCVVYSVGSNFDASFERYVQQSVRSRHEGRSCDTHTYDPTLNPPRRAKQFGEQLAAEGVSRLHLVGLRGDDARERLPFPTQTLREMMVSNRHTCADVVKVDIEGSEHEWLASTPWEELCVGILLFELHGDRARLPKSYDGPHLRTGDVLGYMHRLEQAGLRHYSTEVVGPPSGYSGAERLAGCAEMAFVNASWLRARVQAGGDVGHQLTLSPPIPAAPMTARSPFASEPLPNTSHREPSRRQSRYRIADGVCPHPCASNTVVTAFFDLQGHRDSRAAYLNAFRRLLRALPTDLRMVCFCDAETCDSLRQHVQQGQQVNFQQRDWRNHGPVAALRERIHISLESMSRNHSRPTLRKSNLIALNLAAGPRNVDYMHIMHLKFEFMTAVAESDPFDSQILTWIDAGFFRHPTFTRFSNLKKMCIPPISTARFATGWPWQPWPSWDRAMWCDHPMREILAPTWSASPGYLVNRFWPMYLEKLTGALFKQWTSIDQCFLSTFVYSLPEVWHVPSFYNCIGRNMLNCWPQAEPHLEPPAMWTAAEGPPKPGQLVGCKGNGSWPHFMV